jgi:hypothetical protein
MSFDVLTTEIQSTHQAEKRLTGMFVVKGTSAPTSVYGNWIESIAHTATGVWTITIKSRYRSTFGLLGFNVSLLEATPLGSRVELKSYDLSAGTVVVCAWAEDAYGVAAASDLNTSTDKISVELVIQSTSIKDGSGL